MKALDGYKDNEVEFEVDIFDAVVDEKMLWPSVAKKYDIIYLNYTALAWQFAAMGTFARKYGRKIVFDCDDNLWGILPDNPAYEAWKPGTENISNLSAICREVDYITCTSSYLKNVINHHTHKQHEKIKVFPNYIDLSFYSHRSPFKDTYNIQLTHFGSTTHFISLQEQEFARGVDRIMKEYPNVTFNTIGAFIPKFRERWGNRYVNTYGHQDIKHWVTDPDKFPKFMDETDIMVVPLSENMYNRCKSSIKFLEASSSMHTGVWQNIRQYQEVVNPGINGFLASRADDWYTHIKNLIDDVDLRRELGQEAFKTVVDSWQIQPHVKDYAEFFKSIMT